MEITIRSLFKKGNFLKLWLSQTLQSLSMVLLQVIVIVKVYQHTNSIFGSASVLTVMAFGSFFGGILGSYHIHRFSLVHILHWIGWARAGLTVILAFLLTNIQPVFFILLLMTLFFISVVGSWYQPARFALLPLVVSKKEYMKANGTINVIHQLFLVGGWGLGGVIATTLPFYLIIVIISVSFLLSGILIRLIQIDHSVTREESDKPEKAWIKLMRVGIIRNLTLMDVSESLANVVWSSAFIVAFTDEVLKKGSEWLGFINASYWIGGILGSLMVVLIAKYLEKRIGFMIGLSSLAMAILTFFFATNTNEVLSLLLCVFMGPLYQARDICQETILQDVIPPNERASVMAARSTILTPWSSVAYLVMGWIADSVNIQFTYILGAVLYSITFLIILLHPSLRNYQYHAEKKI